MTIWTERRDRERERERENSSGSNEWILWIAWWENFQGRKTWSFSTWAVIRIVKSRGLTRSDQADDLTAFHRIHLDLDLPIVWNEREMKFLISFQAYRVDYTYSALSLLRNRLNCCLASPKAWPTSIGMMDLMTMTLKKMLIVAIDVLDVSTLDDGHRTALCHWISRIRRNREREKTKSQSWGEKEDFFRS